MGQRKGYKQSPEHVARRIAARHPDGPKMAVVVCRFCGVATEAPSKVARQRSTCGSPECVKRRRVEGGSKPKGQGAANPRYRDGQWTQTEKTCEVCGATFVGPARRRYCSPGCTAKGQSAERTGHPYDAARKNLMKGRSGTGPKSEAFKDALAARLRGAANPNWLGGRAVDINRSDRRYDQWRMAVLGRDAQACQTCGSTQNVIAHHIKEWRPYPDLRYVIENGISLCKSCHSRVHSGRISLVIRQ